MPMADFGAAAAFLLPLEGGFVDHPSDPGGATHYGVSLRFLQKEYGLAFDLDHDGDVDGADVRLLSRADAERIYREKWWERYGYGSVADQEIANRLLSFAVNAGHAQAVKLLQRACRACGWTLKDDGVLGPATLKAVNTVRPESLLPSLRSEAAGFYRVLATMHPEWERDFLSGWLNRAYA